jgi:L-ascorbate metabolism protein UlaG (beta-lactamase superfamily)
LIFVWKGSSAVYLRVEGVSLLIDPSSLFSIDEINGLGGLDIVLFTHEHSDHFDIASLNSMIEEFRPRVVGNPGAYRMARRSSDIIRIRDGEMIEFEGVKVHALRSVHPGHHPVVFLLEIGSISIFHGDSTGFSKSFSAFSPVDLAFIPVGSPSPNSSPSEAVRIARAVVPSLAVPIHGDDSERSEFIERIKLSNLNIKTLLPEIGEIVTLDL